MSPFIPYISGVIQFKSYLSHIRPVLLRSAFQDVKHSDLVDTSSSRVSSRVCRKASFVLVPVSLVSTLAASPSKYLPRDSCHRLQMAVVAAQFGHKQRVD